MFIFLLINTLTTQPSWHKTQIISVILKLPKSQPDLFFQFQRTTVPCFAIRTKGPATGATAPTCAVDLADADTDLCADSAEGDTAEDRTI